MYHPDGNYDSRSPDAQSIDLPVSYKTITTPQTLRVSGTDLRVRGGPPDSTTGCPGAVGAATVGTSTGASGPGEPAAQQRCDHAEAIDRGQLLAFLV